MDGVATCLLEGAGDLRSFRLRRAGHRDCPGARGRIAELYAHARKLANCLGFGSGVNEGQTSCSVMDEIQGCGLGPLTTFGIPEVRTGFLRRTPGVPSGTFLRKPEFSEVRWRYDTWRGEPGSRLTYAPLRLCFRASGGAGGSGGGRGGRVPSAGDGLAEDPGGLRWVGEFLRCSRLETAGCRLGVRNWKRERRREAERLRGGKLNGYKESFETFLREESPGACSGEESRPPSPDLTATGRRRREELPSYLVLRYDDSMANQAFVFRICLNREQEVLMNRTLGCCRFVWNRMLTDRKIRY
jgi:hypothetical protein